MKFFAKAFIKELFLIGQAGSDTTVKIAEKDSAGKITRATCTTVPSATAGYAVGCLLINTSTGQLYVNTGSATSCTFTTAEAGTTATLAAAGNNLATAADITADFTAVTGADGTKAVSLPVPEVGKIVTIINTDASNNLPVYPDAAGTQINALGAGNAFTITPGQTATFVCRSSTLWYVAAATDTIAGLTASAAELNLLDDSVAGTSVASKALVLGASKNTDILGLPVSGLKIGAAGAEVAVDASAAEMNLLKNAESTNNTASKAAVLDSNKRMRTSANKGTAGTDVTAVEIGDGMNHTTILTVNVVDALTLADNAALADGYLVYTFPAGEIIVESAYMSMAVTAAEDTTATADVGIGTTIGAGANATLNLVGAGAENILTGQTAADCNGTPTVKTAIPTAAVPLVIAAADDHTVYFNVADTWADTAGADLTADIAGTIVLNWKFMA